MDTKRLLTLLLGVALLGVGACHKNDHPKGPRTKGPARRSQSWRLQGRSKIHFAADARTTHLCLLDCHHRAEFSAGREDRSVHRRRACAESLFHRNDSEPGTDSRNRRELHGGTSGAREANSRPATSTDSNHVTATSHTEDFPAGLPKPRLFAHPLYQCGHAVLVEDVVPGSSVTVHAEDDAGGGAFKPIQDVGGFQASTSWGLNWTGVNPEFTLAARISATAKLCTDNSPRSDYEITIPGPSPVPPGSLEKPVIDGQTLVNVWGRTGHPATPRSTA